jgi:hypothetical protein
VGWLGTWPPQTIVLRFIKRAEGTVPLFCMIQHRMNPTFGQQVGWHLIFSSEILTTPQGAADSCLAANKDATDTGPKPHQWLGIPFDL